MCENITLSHDGASPARPCDIIVTQTREITTGNLPPNVSLTAEQPFKDHDPTLSTDIPKILWLSPSSDTRFGRQGATLRLSCVLVHLSPAAAPKHRRYEDAAAWIAQL